MIADRAMMAREKALALAIPRYPNDDDAALRFAARLLDFLLQGPTPVTARSPKAIDAAKTNVVRRRFTSMPELQPETVRGLDANHPAVVEKRTLFPNKVVKPAAADRVLVSGANNRELGDRIVKGPWRGMPLYQLTLEERATCPETCFHWQTCYGNALHWSRRHATDGLMEKLEIELAELDAKHINGFAVRLHTLGDFYSVEYVEFWRRMIRQFGGLHVFGYTARPKDTEIGAALWALTSEKWDRFAIRWSSADPQPLGATTIFRMPEGPVVKEGIVCPNETGKTDCCGTCGLCWSEAARDKTIVFIAHGPSFKQTTHNRAHNSAPDQAKPESRARDSSRQAVLDAIRTIHARGDRAVVASIAAVSRVSFPTVNKVLGELQKECVVERAGAGRVSDWKIVDSGGAPAEKSAERTPHPYTWVPTGTPTPEPRRPANRPISGNHRTQQVIDWLTAQGGRATILTKTSLSVEAGVPKGSIAYICDQLEKRGVRLWHNDEGRFCLELADAAKDDVPAPRIPTIEDIENVETPAAPALDDMDVDDDAEIDEDDEAADADLEEYLSRPLPDPHRGTGQWEDRPPVETKVPPNGALGVVIDFLREIDCEVTDAEHSGSYIVDGVEMTPNQLIRHANNHRVRRKMSPFVVDEGQAGVFGSSAAEVFNG